MSWNRFLFPLVVVTRQELFTVPVALQALANTSVMSNYGVVMAAATLAALPLLVLYLIMQRWLMSGIMQGFMKL
jgi:ABC-type glycerol-3-phosphate transport system permease component